VVDISDLSMTFDHTSFTVDMYVAVTTENSTTPVVVAFTQSMKVGVR
jgi:hypothetical protein